VGSSPTLRTNSKEDKMSTVEELGAALLWLRNHYEVGDPQHKPLVLKVIDQVLMGDDKVNTWVDLNDIVNFRKKYINDIIKFEYQMAIVEDEEEPEKKDLF
jgi:hypothetical protein